MINRSGRRAISPAGFLLALLCFGLPFVTVSCEAPVMTVSADYTGWDFVFGGEPDVVVTGMGKDLSAEQARASTPWQPLAFLAFLVVTSGFVLAVSRPRQQRLTSVGTASAAALLLFANQAVTRGGIIDELRRTTFLPAGVIDDMVESRVGYWLTMALLFLVAGYNAVRLRLERRGHTVANPARRHFQPPHDRPPPSGW